MRGSPFNPLGAGVLQAEKGGAFWKKSSLEPTSVLDSRRSPSPPTSTSTLGGGSVSSDASGVAALRWPGEPGGGAAGKEEWDLQPIPDALAGMGGERCGLGVDDWEAMLAESAASPGQEQTFLRWIMKDMDDPSGLKHHHQPHHQLLPQVPEFDGGGFGLVDTAFGFEEAIVGAASTSSPPLTTALLPGVKVGGFGNLPSNSPIVSAAAAAPANNLLLQPSLPPGLFYQEPLEEKPPQFGSSGPLNPYLPFPSFTDHHHHQPATPQHLLPPQPKRHHANPSFPDPGGPGLFLRRHQPQQQNIPQLNHIPYHLQQRPMKQKMAGDESVVTAASAAALLHQQQQALVDQLLKAAELVEAGNIVSAHGILARLNHQLPSPFGKPLLRSAFYFKEALRLLLDPTHTPSTPQSPTDVVLKLGAYKAFSEVSPLLHFTNFTCTQALLEEVGGADHIHIVDFDIGVGAQWSSFMQELVHRRPAATPMLKITAFVSSCSHHPLELHLTRENLTNFAAELDIPFEFVALSFDSLDPTAPLGVPVGSGETIAVNLPVGSGYNPPIPTLLRLVKQLSPKIVVSVDQGCDRSELPFSHHFLHTLQSCMVLLDSIDASGTSSDVASKIEQFLVQPRIEGTVLGRHRAGDKMPSWRTLFASAGFLPMHFSNFTETQAECLLKRVQVRGFHVEKRQASLFLNWQHRELASVSAWRC